MFEIESLDWEKTDGLLPVIIQDVNTAQVLMLGYMNQAALEKTVQTKKVTFYSRSKKRLWEKGETSGHSLHLVRMTTDCDKDTLLIQVIPKGPCCHLATTSCFAEEKPLQNRFLWQLMEVIAERQHQMPAGSYIAKLFATGTKRIAQKVGEEGVETALAAVSGDRKEIINEAADLIFHLLILLQCCKISLNEIVDELERRNLNRS